MGEIEKLAGMIQSHHSLRSLHIFTQGSNWRVFGSRGTQAFMASVEEGRGPDIRSALNNLDARLVAGPINRGELPELAPEPSP